MVLLQHANQMLFRNVSISLSGCDRSVTKKLLNYTDVRTVAEKQGCHGMTQHVWSYVAIYSCLQTQLGNDISHPLGREPLTRSIQEKSRTSCLDTCPGIKMRPLKSDGFFINYEGQPIPAAFALYLEHCFFHKVVLDIESRYLSDAHPCSKEDVYQRKVTKLSIRSG